LGSEEVVMVSAVTPIEMLSAAVAVRPPESLTCTLKWKVPLAVGVPLITPVDDSAKPGGSEPDPATTVHV